MSTSILIVDDNAGFRRAARLILEEEGYEVVGEASGVKAGLAAARELRPDVVLLDVHLPDGSGFDAASELAGGPIVVMCSSYEQAHGEELARQSGARAFLPKHELSGPRMTELLT